jgi:hypothetical protein
MGSVTRRVQAVADRLLEVVVPRVDVQAIDCWSEYRCMTLNSVRYRWTRRCCYYGPSRPMSCNAWTIFSTEGC